MISHVSFRRDAGGLFKDAFPDFRLQLCSGPYIPLMGIIDCLYLNIWLPEWPAKARKPVMVWILLGLAGLSFTRAIHRASGSGRS